MKSSDEEDDGVEWLEADASANGGAVQAAVEDDEEEEFEYSDEEQDDAEGVDWEDVAAAPSSSKQPQATAAKAAAESPQRVPGDQEADAELRDEDGSGGDDGNGDDDGDETYEELNEDEDEDEDEAAESESDSDDEDDDRDDEQTLTDLQKVNWDQVNQVLQQEALKAAKKQQQQTKKRKAARMSKADKERELTLHQSHLLLLLATHLKWNALCESPVLPGLLLSLTSGESAFDFYVEMKRHPLKYSLEMLVRWFNRHFRVLSASEAAAVALDDSDQDTEHGNGHGWSELLTESKLMHVFFERKGRDYELAVLFTALCRALRLYCRYTCALDALLMQQSKAFEAASASPSGASNGTHGSRGARSRKQSRTQSGATEAAEQNASVEIASTQSFWVWTEVYDEKRNAWINVDAIRKIVGQSREIEALRGKGAPFSYVVGITHTERLVDVTPRYAEKWSKSMRFRIADKWMELTIEKLNAEAASKRRQTIGYDPFINAADGERVEDKLLAQEKRKLLAMTESEEMPTSIEGFKKHHLYCLERHLGRFECVYPRKAIGIFKGQPVFLRKHIQVTRSRYQWLRLGREVNDSEREKPAKWYKKGKQNSSSGAQDSGDDSDNEGRGGGSRGSNRDGARAMFGVWQTSAFVSPPVVNGIVPKNSYGNIEIWSQAHVPRHAVHLRLPRIEKVAQQLGVDFAQAVVGFEVKNDRNVPMFDGIVVAETALEMLVDAHAHIQQNTIEKAIEKNQQLIAKRWERVVQRLLLRQRLEDNYGAVADSCPMKLS